MSVIDPHALRALGRDRYHGLAFGWIAVVALGLLNLVRGGIHLFRADGGASTIAGIDLSQNGEVILTLFATMGLTQMLLGLIDLAVGLRLRALVPALLVYHLLQQVGAAAVLWWWRPLPVQAPGKFGALAMLPVIALALYCSLRPRRAAEPSIARAAAEEIRP